MKRLLIVIIGVSIVSHNTMGMARAARIVAGTAAATGALAMVAKGQGDINKWHEQNQIALSKGGRRTGWGLDHRPRAL